MRFRIPGQSIHVRIFEKVETTDNQYHVFDTGLDYGNGDVDSIAVGGSFATVRGWAEKADADSLKKQAKKAKKNAKKRAEAEATVAEAEELYPTPTDAEATAA